MAAGYLRAGLRDKICYFEIFFRQVPDSGGFVVAAGLESVIEFVKNLHFAAEDIKFLKAQKLFDKAFLDFLKDFKFSGDIKAVREGEIIFANEPLLSVRARACEAQLLETFLLLSLNHQSLIATKASRIVRAAAGKSVLEFGSRRAQGADAALYGARAAYLAGCAGSACTLAGKVFGVPISGTMAHSWVQMFESELEAFKAYCKLYPHSAVLLLDTYDTLKSGLPNAIKAFKEVLEPLGVREFGVRLDSGDLLKLSRVIRKRLDEAGLKHCKIIASGSLDELEISRLKNAPIDAFGVGEKLITAKSSPVLGCVYKLVATEFKRQISPKIKISESAEKISNPSAKKLYRVFDKKSRKALYDMLCLENEKLSLGANLEAKELLKPIFKKGVCVYKVPSLERSRAFLRENLKHFDEDLKALSPKKTYTIKLSKELISLKNRLLKAAR